MVWSGHEAARLVRCSAGATPFAEKERVVSSSRALVLFHVATLAVIIVLFSHGVGLNRQCQELLVASLLLVGMASNLVAMASNVVASCY